MAFKLTINDTDYTRHLVPTVKPTLDDSLNRSKMLTFSLYPSDGTFNPITEGNRVKFFNGSDCIYSGYIVSTPEREVVGGNYFGYSVTVQSDEWLFNTEVYGESITYSGQNLGEIISDLIVKVGGELDLSHIPVGVFVPKFVVEPEWTFADAAYALCNQVGWRWWVLEGVVHLAPQNDAVYGYDVDVNNPDFNPYGIQMAASDEPVVKDITVIGGLEPTHWMNDVVYAQDLPTTAVDLSEPPFTKLGETKLYEAFASLDDTLWDFTDTNDTLTVDGTTWHVDGAGALAVSKNALELGGEFVFELGDIRFDDISDAVVNGIYSGGYGLANCVAGFYISPKPMNTGIQPIVKGQILNAPYEVQPNRSYKLKMYVSVDQLYRYNTPFLSSNGQFGGDVNKSDGYVTFWITETDLSDPSTPPYDAMVLDMRVTDLPAFVNYVLLNVTRGRFNVRGHASVDTLQPFRVRYNDASMFVPEYRIDGTIQADDVYKASVGLNYTPIQDSTVKVSYRVQGTAKARLVNHSLDGATLMMLVPILRTSVDCINLAQAYLNDHNKVQYEGTYITNPLYLSAMPISGRYIYVNNPSVASAFSTIVRDVKVTFNVLDGTVTVYSAFGFVPLFNYNYTTVRGTTTDSVPVDYTTATPRMPELNYESLGITQYGKPDVTGKHISVDMGRTPLASYTISSTVGGVANYSFNTAEYNFPRGTTTKFFVAETDGNGNYSPHAVGFKLYNFPSLPADVLSAAINVDTDLTYVVGINSLTDITEFIFTDHLLAEGETPVVKFSFIPNQAEYLGVPDTLSRTVPNTYSQRDFTGYYCYTVNRRGELSNGIAVAGTSVKPQPSAPTINVQSQSGLTVTLSLTTENRNDILKEQLDVATDNAFTNVVLSDYRNGQFGASSIILPNAGMYYARARKQDSLGWGSYTSPYNFSVTGLVTSNPDPVAPTVGVATTSYDATTQTSTLTISWTSNGSDAYQVRWGTSQSSYNYQATPSTATTITITGLKPGTTYYYSVAAVNADNKVAYAADQTKVTAGSAKPNTPSGFSVNFTYNSAIITWNQNSESDLIGYHLKRGSTDVVNFYKGTSFTDIGLLANTSYTYTLYAITPAGESVTPASFTGTTSVAPSTVITPDAPTSFTNSNLTGGTSVGVDGKLNVYINVNLGALGGNTAYRRVYISSSGNPTCYQTDQSNLRIDGLIPNTTYSVYYVNVSVSTTASSVSSTATFTTSKNTANPSDPSGVSLIPGFKVMGVSWTGILDADLDYYLIERSLDASFTSPTSFKTRSTYFVDNVSLAVQYYYRVTAYNTSGKYSNAIAASNNPQYASAVGSSDIAANNVLANHIASGQIKTSHLVVDGSADDIGNAVTNSSKVIITPGKIQINGASNTLASWISGQDSTSIAGGKIDTNSIRAQSLQIGARGLDVQGITFSQDGSNSNKLNWSSGQINYINDSGVYTTAYISSGSVTYSGSMYYIYWTVGGTSLSSTTSSTTAVTSTSIVLCTYSGGTSFFPTYGRTTITGDYIATGTITASLIAAGAINASHLATGTLDVGGKSGVSGMLTVWDGTPSAVGYIGQFSNGFVSGTTYGAWFKTLGIGGTAANPKIWADASGNVTIGSSVTIGSGQVTGLGPFATASSLNATDIPNLDFSKITTGSLWGQNITSTTIDGSHITTGSVTANKLTLIPTMGQSLNADPFGQDTSVWTAKAGVLSQITGITDLTVGTTALANIIGTQLRLESGTLIPLDYTKNYRVRVTLKQLAGTPVNGTFVGIAWYDANKSLINASTANPAGWAGNGTYSYFVNNIAAPNNWTEYVASFGASETAKIPATAKYMAIGLYLNNSAVAGMQTAVTNLQIAEKTDASLIVDGTITASKIVSIGSDQVSGLGVLATQNSVTKDQMPNISALNGMLWGQAIGTTTIDGSHITAGTITANKMFLTATGNVMNADPACADITAWASDINAITQVTGISDLIGSSTAIANTTGTTAYVYTSEFIPLDTSKNYRIEMALKQIAGTGGTAFLGVGWYNSNKVLLDAGTYSPAGWVSNGTYSYFGLVNDIVPTSWTNYSVAFGPNETCKPCTNTRYVRLVALLNYNTTIGSQIAMSNVKLLQKSDANLIVDGAITANKIAAGAVTATSIAAGAITTSKLTISNMDNLIPNPNGAEVTDSTILPEGAAVFDAGIGQGYAATRWVRKVAGTGSASTVVYVTKYIPCNPNDQFYIEAQCKLYQGSQYGGYVGITFYDANQSSLYSNNSGSWNSPVSWGKVSWTDTAPTNTVYVRFWIAAGQNSYAYFSALYARRMADANLIVQGSISSDKLNATAIEVGGYATNPKPSYLGVRDNSNGLVGYIGTYSSTQLGGTVYGGWFKTLGVGGTKDAPKLWADTSGNVTMYGGTIQDASGNPVTSNGAIDPTLAGFLLKGSLPPSLSQSFIYTADTTSITWKWGVQGVFRADGTKSTVLGGYVNIVGLKTGATYYVYPYYDEADSTLKFVGASDIVSPTFYSPAFDGSTNHITTSSSMAAITGSLSIECWFKTTDTSTSTLVSFTDSATGVTTYSYPQITVTAAGVITFWVKSSAGTTYSISSTDTGGSSQPYNDGLWHHVVGVFTASTATNPLVLYVDGNQITKSSNTTPITLQSYTGYWHIGGITTYLAGDVTHVSVFNSALQPWQIVAHYQAGLNLGTDSYEAAVANDYPVHYWYVGGNTGGFDGSDHVSSGQVSLTQYGNTISFSSSNVLVPTGTPAVAWVTRSFVAAQAQLFRSHIPLSGGGMAASTTTAGTAGGGGGGTTGGVGGGGCFSPNTRVVTSTGLKEMKDIETGELVLTGKDTWKPVKRIHVHSYRGPMQDMGNNEYVTPSHHILPQDEEWVEAAAVFNDTVDYEGVIMTLEIEVHEDERLTLSPYTEHSFKLGNGQIVHNIQSQLSTK